MLYVLNGCHVGIELETGSFELALDDIERRTLGFKLINELVGEEWTDARMMVVGHDVSMQW